MNVAFPAKKATSSGSADEKLFLALLHLGTASNATVRSRYGSDLSGLVSEPFVDAGSSILGDPSLRALPTGFVFTRHWKDGDGEEQSELVTIDYALRQKLMFGTALQSPSLGLDRAVGEIAEKSLRLSILSLISSNGFMPWAFKRLNLSPLTKTGRRFAARTKAWIAQRLATGIVNDAMRNTLAEKNRRGFPVTARRFPPSLRRGIWSAINVPDMALGRARADLFEQAPILALAPDAVASGAGASPKKLLKALGLPPLAAKIRAAALSPVAKYKREHLDLPLPQLLGGVTHEVLAVMDDATFRQRLLLALALRLRHALSPSGVETFLVWFAHASKVLAATELRLHDLALLSDYLRAPAALAEQTGARPFNVEMAIGTVIEQASAFADGATKLKGGSTVPFPALPWAPMSGPLPHSTWHLVRLTCERDLIVEGKAMGNCVASYAGACMSGREAIFSVRRFTGTGGKGQALRGATASFVRLPDGRIVISQLRAPANRRASDSVRAALTTAGHIIIDG